MSQTKKERKGRAVPVGVGILVFILAFASGVVSKFAIKPSWAKEYAVQITDEIGKVYKDIAYGGGDANKFDLYAYRDAADSPVPVKMMFEAVGPSSFYRSDWGVYGLDQDTDESRKAAAGLFGIMLGQEIHEDILDTPGYDETIKPISAFMWVDENSAPSVIAYGAHDRVCPFGSAAHLVNALKENGVDYKYFEMPHSGHGLQNDDKIYEQYMEAVKEYLDKYTPVVG